MPSVLERSWSRPALVALQIGTCFFLALPLHASERRLLVGTRPAAAAILKPIGVLPDSTRLDLVISMPLRQQPDWHGFCGTSTTRPAPNSTIS